MSRYRKIDPRIWNDEKFRALSDDGKLAFLFLLTHPAMTALGAMRGTAAGLAAELKWTPARMGRAIGESVDQGIVETEPEASFLALPRFLKYNEPEGPNSVTKAWIESLDLIPECSGKSRVIERCRKYLEGKSDAFRHAIGDAISHAFEMPSPDPCPIQEQEQEQEQEKKPPPTPSTRRYRDRTSLSRPHEPGRYANVPMTVMTAKKNDEQAKQYAELEAKAEGRAE